MGALLCAGVVALYPATVDNTACGHVAAVAVRGTYDSGNGERSPADDPARVITSQVCQARAQELLAGAAVLGGLTGVAVTAALTRRRRPQPQD